MPKEKKETKVRKGKKKRKKRRSSERWKKYRIEGNKVIREAKSCPRCGPGIFLAKHKDRLFCGKCRYTEYTK